MVDIPIESVYTRNIRNERNTMKQDFVEWIQEGLIDKIITVKTARDMYIAMYDDFIEGDFERFIFSF
jgi:hypothetical protein